MSVGKRLAAPGRRKFWTNQQSPFIRWIGHATAVSSSREEMMQEPISIWLLPLFGDKKPVPYLRTEFNERTAKLSPDGRWLAYASDETNRYEIYVNSFPTQGDRFLISSNGGRLPIWSRDGKELFFIAGDRKLMAVAVQSGPRFQAAAPKPLFETRLPGDITRFDVGKDGRFLIPTQTAPAGGAVVNLVVNWTAGLKK